MCCHNHGAGQRNFRKMSKEYSFAIRRYMLLLLLSVIGFANHLFSIIGEHLVELTMSKCYH